MLVSWDMVKKKLTKDREFQDLAGGITGGCIEPPEILPIHLKQFWRFRGDLRVMDRVPMMGERTVPVVPNYLFEHVCMD